MHDRINLFLQPAYNYNSHKIEYAEILIRGYRGIDSVPKILAFVQLSQTESIFDIDVLKETLRILNYYEKLDYPIGVNLCPSTIAKSGISDEIISIIKDNNLSNNEIVIEVNECTDFKNSEVIENIKNFKKNGIQIALDDFGTNTANLCTLLCNDIDILKVDKVFIDKQSEENEESQTTILKKLLEICNELNLKHVVEGIETDGQLENIENIGYSVVQGFLYKKPISLKQYMAEEATLKRAE
jgi:EAL domain-containing protein (putative c-di-GMP-specific phosphodiesterase class I)